MIKKIPSEIKELYQGLGFKPNLYISLRWRLCPFEKIEKYLPKSGLILDLGCGYGLLTNLLALKSAQRQVIGIDNSPKRIEVAQLTIGNRSNIKFIRGDIQNLDLPECQGIAMSDFLHHLSNQVWQNLLIRVFNQLSPGGKLVIEEVNNKPFWKYLSNIFIDNLLYFGQKINFKSVNYWQKILKEIGFQVEIVSADQEIPLADVIFICTKK